MAGLKPDLPNTRSATPTKPINKPSDRNPPGRSLSHSQATSAPDSGTVAFKMAERPVAMCSTANAYSAKGSAEFSRPTNRIAPARWRNCSQTPGSKNTGSKNKVPKATRKPAVGTAPNSAAPRCMNKNDAPQSAASKTNSAMRVGDMSGECAGFEAGQ